MKKILTLLILTVFTLSLPTIARAEFNPANIIDPFCLFSCDDPEPTVINNTNSNNINSNVNSPNSTVVNTQVNSPNNNPSTVATDYTSNYTSSLGASCYPTSSNGNIGDSVVWRVSAYGGTGYYNYSWSGTNGLSGSGSSISINYNSAGSKTATVNITSGNQIITRNCGSVLIYDNVIVNPPPVIPNDSTLGASCYPTYSSGNIGDSISWRVSAYGGNGNYYYSWSGTNGLSGSGSNAYITYNSAGSKTASVNITSGNQTITRNCGTVIIYDNYNNNNYYDNNNYYYNTLGVSCYPAYSTGNIDDTVTWRASPYGGNGNYSYSWSGTDNLYGYSSSVSQRYGSSGIKRASVTITSAGQSITRDCGTVDINNYYNNSYYNNDYYYNYNYNYNNTPILATCNVNATFAPVGTRVTWTANVSGGNGSYYYVWNGTDNLSGYNRTNEVVYNAPGTKTAYVTVRSGNQSVTQYCTNSVIVGAPIAGYNTYVPTYTQPTTVIKYVEKPAKTTAVKAKSTDTKTAVESKTGDNEAITAASLFSLKNIPWGLVSVLVIMVLLFMVVYLIFTRKKE